MEPPNLDGSMVPHFVLVYVSIYFIGYTTVFKNWGPKNRPDGSSCLISLTHGTPSVLLSLYANFRHPEQHFAARNTALQALTLDFSIAYFLTDTSHYFIFARGDRLFIGHHLAVLYVLVTCRYVVGHGAFAVLVLLATAEATSGCQNVWSLVRCRKDDVAAAERAYGRISPVFFGFYAVVRGVVGPVFVCKMVGFYWNGGGDGVVPRWAWVSWMGVVVNAILVSVLWVGKLWVDFFKERTKIRKLSRKKE